MKPPTPLGPPYGPRHSPTVGSYGEAVSNERGMPVLKTLGPHFASVISPQGNHLTVISPEELEPLVLSGGKRITKNGLWVFSGPHECTYANRMHVIVNASSNFRLVGHVTVRSRHWYVTKC
jgi:hypothetical protein